MQIGLKWWMEDDRLNLYIAAAHSDTGGFSCDYCQSLFMHRTTQCTWWISVPSYQTRYCFGGLITLWNTFKVFLTLKLDMELYVLAVGFREQHVLVLLSVSEEHHTPILCSLYETKRDQARTWSPVHHLCSVSFAVYIHRHHFVLLQIVMWRSMERMEYPNSQLVWVSCFTEALSSLGWI